MSIPEEREMLLSQLVDHELPADQASRVLLEVLDDPEARRRLKTMLRLRQTLGLWREQEPARAIVAVPLGESPGGDSGPARPLLSLAAAVALGGVLVAAGFYLAGQFRKGPPEEPIAAVPEQPASRSEPAAPGSRQPAILVTPEQRREIAQAFALHESVAGPLSWYVADDSHIRVAPASEREDPRPPVAVVLRLTPAGARLGSEGKTYVIVCRVRDMADIELPQTSTDRTVRLRLLFTEAEGDVNLRYAIAAVGSDHWTGDGAALAGRRHIGLRQTSLGQLALDDRLVNVDASAWVIRDEHGQ